jgi:hypothetical protein
MFTQSAQGEAMEINVGDTVAVRFNGHPYQGVVLSLTKKRFVVRFTTGSGRTRETAFRLDWFFKTGIAGAYAGPTMPSPLQDAASQEPR